MEGSISSTGTAAALRAARIVRQRLRAIANSQGRSSSGAPCESSERWRAQEGLLEGVLALVLGAEHVPAEAEQRPVVAVVDDLEGALVAGGGELGETGVVEPSDPEADKRGSDRGRRHLVTHLPTP